MSFEFVAVSEGQQAPEAGLLISELLHSVNQSGLLVEQLRMSWAGWLSEKTASSSPVLLGILRVIGIAAVSPTTLGQLLEAALEAYFKHSGMIIIDYQLFSYEIFGYNLKGLT